MPGYHSRPDVGFVYADRVDWALSLASEKKPVLIRLQDFLYSTFRLVVYGLIIVQTVDGRANSSFPEEIQEVTCYFQKYTLLLIDLFVIDFLLSWDDYTEEARLFCRKWHIILQRTVLFII